MNMPSAPRGSKRPLLCACLWASLFAAPVGAQTYPYIIEDLGAHSNNGSPGDSQGYAINSKGEVACVFGQRDGSHLGVYRNGSGLVDLGTPDPRGYGLLPSGINDTGQIAVTSDYTDYPQAYLYDPKQGYLNAGIAAATGINRAGNIIGQGYYSNGAAAAFESFFATGGLRNLDQYFALQNPRQWQMVTGRGIADDESYIATGFRFPQLPYGESGGGFFVNGSDVQDLGSLGGSYTIPLALNASHQVVGYAETGALYGNAEHAFLWENGGITDLGVLPNTASSHANAINSAGDVVGIAANGQAQLFYYHAGSMRSLADLIDPAENWYFNTVFANATGINDRGQICGYAAHIMNGGLIERAFRMTPRSALAADVSNQVAVKRSGFRYNHATGRFLQTVTLTNTGGTPLAGPLSLTLDSLSANAHLVGGAGQTYFLTPAGSPYADTSGGLAAGAAVTLTLEFSDPSLASIAYTTRVLAGTGLR